MWISISHIAYVIFKTYVASDWTNGGVKQEQKPILQKAYLKVCVCALFLHLFKFQVLEKHKTWNEKRSRFFYIIVCIQNFKLLHCVSLAIFFMKKKLLDCVKVRKKSSVSSISKRNHSSFIWHQHPTKTVCQILSLFLWRKKSSISHTICLRTFGIWRG